MNRKELQLALEKLSPEDFQDFVRKFGGTHESPESVVRAFVDNPSFERRLCQLLDLITEEEKIVQAALDAAVNYAKERQQFGQRIANFQAIQWMLADMATQIDAARLLTYRACYLESQHLPFIKESAMAKVFAPEAAMFVTTKAIQIYGGYGYVKDYPMERYFRDAKICGIYEGTDEMQRMTIARSLIREG